MTQAATLPERITAIVAHYPHWSPAELRHLDQITESVLSHMADGTGNLFVQEFCKRVVIPTLNA